MIFSEKILDPTSQIHIHTITPPSQAASDTELEIKLNHIQRLIDEVCIDAINIPEVFDEQREARVTPFDAKVSPVEFGRLIRDSIGQTPDIIIDRVIVQSSLAEQKKSIELILNEFGNLLLVGGQSSKISYPGPPVDKAAQQITSELHSNSAHTLGAIAIPTRRNPKLEFRERDEPYKLVRKQSEGIQYFVSQVIYEAESTMNLLRDYQALCSELELKPARLLLSFAPIASQRDLQFLKWWQVGIPKDVEHSILRSGQEIFDRSVETCRHILTKILNYICVERISVPIGINIEHVSTRNLERSIELSSALKSTFQNHCGKGAVV